MNVAEQLGQLAGCRPLLQVGLRKSGDRSRLKAAPQGMGNVCQQPIQCGRSRGIAMSFNYGKSHKVGDTHRCSHRPAALL